MAVSLEQYRRAIGSFNGAKYILLPAINLLSRGAKMSVFTLMCMIIILLLILSNDIELNPGPLNTRNLSVGHCNIRGIRANLADLKVLLTTYYDIFCLTETMLSQSVGMGELKIKGYQTPVRRDRDHNGGGLMIYLSNNVRAKRRNDLESPSIETIWVECEVKGIKLLICNCYRPPNAGIDFWDALQSQLDRVKQGNLRQVIILGDLNADFNTTPGRYLNSLAQQNHLCLHINKPTRYSTSSSTCLDQIISNIPYLFRTFSVTTPVGKSDHCVVNAEFAVRVEKMHCYSRKVWYYNKADFDKFRTALSQHNWDPCFASDSPDSCCTDWTSTFLEIASRCIPNKMVVIRPNDVPWYNKHLRGLKKKKDRSHSYAKKHNNSSSWATYRFNRNNYVNELHAAEEEYYRNMASKLCQGSQTSHKTWWQTVKLFLGRNSDSEFPPIDDGIKTNFTNIDKANAFNNFFLNNASLDCKNASLPDNVSTTTRPTLSKVTATEQDVTDILKSLDVNKATGPDGISPKMLREAGETIAKPLTRLINMSLSTTQFPETWKLANVLPLFKKNDKTQINNYRPISLLSCVSKIAERVVFKYTFNFIRDHRLITKFQSGFTPGNSTINQLVHVYHLLCEALDKKKEVRVVFLWY